MLPEIPDTLDLRRMEELEWWIREKERDLRWVIRVGVTGQDKTFMKFKEVWSRIVDWLLDWLSDTGVRTNQGRTLSLELSFEFGGTTPKGKESQDC